MSKRNAPCPCGSGKKYKRCCLMLSSAIKSNESLQSGEELLRLSILDLANRTIQNMKAYPSNKDKTYGLDDFEIIVGISVALWNMSFLASSRVSELLEYVENAHFRSKVKEIAQWARSLNTIRRLMILEAIPSTDGKVYSLEIQTCRPDKSIIEGSIGLILGDVLDGVDHMLENGDKKE